MSIKPITPNDVVSKKLSSIPDFVIEAFNEIIAENCKGGISSFKQNKIVKLIISKMTDGSSVQDKEDKIFESHWLDVESIYRKAGWIVDYDKPGYNETYEASFTFTKKR